MRSEKEYIIESTISQIDYATSLRALSATDAMLRVLAESESTVFGKSIRDVFNFVVWTTREDLMAFLSIADELYNFSDYELTEIDMVLKRMNIVGYERLDPTTEFRTKYALSIDGFVWSVNHGEGKPLLIKLLTSTEVDPKAFAYLLAVMTHHGSMEEDVYTALALSIEGVQFTESETALLAKVLRDNGFNPAKVGLVIEV